MNDINLPGKHQVKASVIINAPIDTVWALLKDFGNVHRWAPAVTESYSTTSAPTGVGAGRYCKLEEFGEIKEYVTHWREGEGFVYDVTPLGPLDRSFSKWSIDAVDEQHTQVEVTFSYNLRFGIFGSLLHSLVMRRKLETSLPSTLDALKGALDSDVNSRHTSDMQSSALA